MLTQKSVAQLNFDDDTLSRFQTNVADALDQVLDTPIVDSVLVEGLTIPANGKLTVPHGLNRKARGYFVVYANAATAVPYVVAADQTAPMGAIVLTFSSGAGAVVSIEVF